jgi:hypothetical protein
VANGKPSAAILPPLSPTRPSGRCAATRLSRTTARLANRRFANVVVQPAKAQQRCAPTIPAGYGARVWNLLRQPCHVAAGRVENPPLPGSHHSPFAIRDSQSFSIRHSLFAIRHSLFLRSPLAARHSPLAVFRHSPFAIRHSLSFSIRYSPFAIRRISPLAARRSPLAARRLYPFPICEFFRRFALFPCAMC